MTTTTYQGTSQDVWSVLFDNRKYKDLLDEVNKLIEDTKRLYKKGYRLEAIDEQQKPKVTEIENKFKQFATDRLNEIEQRCNEIEKESQQDNVKDPQTEIIKRQNLEARLSFYNDSEIVDYINSKDVTNTDIYELSLLQQKYDNQLNESQQRRVAFKLEELKQGVLYPYTTNEEYKNLMFEYSVINQTGMAKTGVVITKNEQYGGVEIKPLTERYKNAIDEVKQSNNRR
ncbi:hypothetical protein H3965_10330 [Staphylococcus epidermidis]|uniref:hypothetical protein n=1 Tax=Staphylococcus epidermidis TaxID=1282 RepID=UPI00138AD2F3|nr:hypothetical protein [Staphylococcus epidermidis]MBF2233404.1 hypothetical protein [Staphylococcus epidermidis]